ncbi:MAG: carbohydrate ABC transporter permease [Clostridia bacterium]|nr:carbohydrate ABC transporter permease [Clostridia bacterium]
MATKMKKKGLYYQIVIGALLVVYALIMASLFYFTFVNSCKDPWGFIQDAVGLPEQWFFLENYETIILKLKMQANVKAPIYYIEDMFLGSLGYAMLSAGGIVIATTMVAYACVQFPNFKMSSVMYFLAMFVITVPIVGSLPSEMQVIRGLGFYNQLWSAFILKFTFGNIYFLLLYEAIKGIPKDYKEAAQVDGASQLRVMLQIMLPMVKNVIGSIFLIQFIAFWNDYSTPLIYMPSVPNISVGVMSFAFSTKGEIAYEPYKLAACLVVMLPILAVFIVFQKTLLGSISEGGIKG